jgi:hypothetical protein
VTLSHPLDSIPPQWRSWVFIPLIVTTLAVSLLLGVIDQPLQTEAAPTGIVSFELARTVEQASRIVASWNEKARAHAGFSLGFDYVFLLLYSTTIAMICLRGGEALRVRGRPLGSLAPWLAWGQWGAALFDAVENVALFVVLVGPVASPWPQLAWGCALVKFGLIAAGLLYVILAAVLVIGRRTWA